jgi:hypothetical protein
MEQFRAWILATCSSTSQAFKASIAMAIFKPLFSFAKTENSMATRSSFQSVLLRFDFQIVTTHNTQSANNKGATEYWYSYVVGLLHVTVATAL